MPDRRGRWQRRRGAVIDYATAEEHAFSRPFVTHDADGYWMWYAYRGQRYRIGCARSPDGLTWTRTDDRGLDPSGEGWDSESVAYPWILDANGRRYMLYNGKIGRASCR